MSDVEVKLPRFDPSMDEAVITEWLKKEGDSVNEGEPIANAEGEKSSSEVESPEKGKIKELKYEEGDEVEIGEVIAIIESE